METIKQSLSKAFKIAQMRFRIYTNDGQNWYVQELVSGFHLHHEKSRKKGKQRCEEWLSKYRNSIF